ncbi:MAG: hypothetical protein V1799_06205 [bacterium]
MKKLSLVRLLPVIVLGLSSIATQIFLLREFLSLFQGNELVVGLILSTWMMLTGLGAFLGRFASRWALNIYLSSLLLILLAVLPLSTTICLRVLRNEVFQIGLMIGLMEIFVSSFIILLPICMISGFAFSHFVQRLSSQTESNETSRVYAWEALGGVIGGALFNIFLISYANTIQCFALLGMINLSAALMLVLQSPRKIMGLGIILFLFIGCGFALFSDLDRTTRAKLFPDQTLLVTQDSPYGNLTVTQQEEQLNFYENGVLLASSNDAVRAEESVHFALVQRERIESVLMISGAVTGSPKEVLKYSSASLDYLEANPWLISLTEQYTEFLSDSRILCIAEDARLFIRKTTKRYDAILLNLPEPATAQMNRYYTKEFFLDLQRCMNSDAVLSLGLLPETDYQSKQASVINSTMVQTLKSVFKNVVIVPGTRNYFLASDGGLSLNIAGLATKRGIQTTYVNENYLDDYLLQRRSLQILDRLSTSASLNLDFQPISYYQQVIHWLRYFSHTYWLMVLVALAFTSLLLFLNFTKISFGLLTGGFTATSLEVLYLILFQILFGSMYQIIGMLVTVFMAGLAAGTLLCPKIVPHVTMKQYGAMQLLLGAFSILSLIFLFYLGPEIASGTLIFAIIALFLFLIAFLVGMEFFTASKLQFGSVPLVSSKLYTTDLVGSALGAGLVALLILPLFGVLKTGIIIGAMSFVSGCVALLKKR